MHEIENMHVHQTFMGPFHITTDVSAPPKSTVAEMTWQARQLEQNEELARLREISISMGEYLEEHRHLKENMLNGREDDDEDIVRSVAESEEEEAMEAMARILQRIQQQ